MQTDAELEDDVNHTDARNAIMCTRISFKEFLSAGTRSISR